MKSGHVLAIKHLPSAAADLVPGGVYLLLHDEPAPIARLAWPTLIAASDVAPAQWVTECDVEQELASATLLAERMRKAVNSGKIRVLQKKQSVTPGRLLQELDYFGLERGAQAVIDGAADFLAEPDSSIAAARVLAERNGICLLLFCSAAKSPAEFPGKAAAARLFTGIARLRQTGDSMNWELLHWFGRGAAMANESFRLRIDMADGLSAERIEAPRPVPDSADDESSVYVTRAALAGKEPPAAWHVVEDLEALEAKLVSATAATLILHFDQYTKLENLGRMIYGLRHSSGNRIKILIREVNVHLRYSQEQLLLRLGANLVIPAEVLFSRVQSFVGMVQGQIFPHSLEDDYEATVAIISPSAERGYLAPQAFVGAVRGAMARVNPLMIQNALVRLPLAPGLTPLIALRACWMKRGGDFCTADQSSLYIFLFACRESDIELTLDRQFSYPVHDLFDGELRYLTPESVREAVDELAAAASSGKLPDLSAEIPRVESRQEPGLLSSSAEALIHRNAPSPAVRRPLVLRQRMEGANP